MSANSPIKEQNELAKVAEHVVNSGAVVVEPDLPVPKTLAQAEVPSNATESSTDSSRPEKSDKPDIGTGEEVKAATVNPSRPELTGTGSIGSNFSASTTSGATRSLRLQRTHSTIDSSSFIDMGRLKNFEIIEKLGQGTFGVVQKARCKRTNKLVAIKQLINHSAKEGFPITAMREITILKQLNHANILRIGEMIHEDPKVKNAAELVTQRGCFYTVSPYMCSDLVGLLENPNVHLELSHIKCLMEQLFIGIQYVHDQKFLHRDIKAANILIDFDGVLKIADFGLARTYHGHAPKLHSGPGGGERSYTGLVVTRWYRPPELLLGERKYTTAVDLWGIGCVFAELFTHKPILVGSSDVHQAQLVFNLVGPPTNWTHAAQLPNKSDFNIGLTCKRTLETRFRDLLPPDGIDLLSGLLTLDPYKRLNALDALNHDFFKTEPLPLKPSQLPKFEESHEIDTKRFKKMKERIQSGAPPTVPSGPKNFASRPEPSYTSRAQQSSKENMFAARNSREIRDRENDARDRTDSYRPIQNSRQDFRNDARHDSRQDHRQDARLDYKQDVRQDYRPEARLDQRDSKVESREPMRTDTYRPDRDSYSRRSKDSRRPNLPTRPINSSTSEAVDSSSKSDRGPVSTPSSNSLVKNRVQPGSASAGIFMTRKRTVLSNVQRPTSAKKAKMHRSETDSDLSDVDGNEINGEEESFKSFLDYEGFQKDSEYRKMANERIKHAKNLGMNY